MELTAIDTTLIFLALGGVTGFTAGLLGVGGGIVMLPVLLFVFTAQGMPQSVIFQVIIGTNMFIIIFTSLFAVIKHQHAGMVMWRASIPLGLASIPGAMLGSTIAAYASFGFLKYGFGLLMAWAAYRSFKSMQPGSDEQQPVFDLRYVIPTGFLAGALGAMLGVGGGVVSIPIMALFLHYPYKRLAATSSGIILFTAAAATFTNIYHGWSVPDLPANAVGYVNITAAIPIIIGALPCAPLGAWVNNHLNTRPLKMIFGLFMAAMSIRFFLL